MGATRSSAAPTARPLALLVHSQRSLRPPTGGSSSGALLAGVLWPRGSRFRLAHCLPLCALPAGPAPVRTPPQWVTTLCGARTPRTTALARATGEAPPETGRPRASSSPDQQQPCDSAEGAYAATPSTSLRRRRATLDTVYCACLPLACPSQPRVLERPRHHPQVWPQHLQAVLQGIRDGHWLRQGARDLWARAGGVEARAASGTAQRGSMSCCTHVSLNGSLPRARGARSTSEDLPQLEHQQRQQQQRPAA